MLEPLANGPLPPAQVELAPRPLAPEPVGDLDEALRRVWPPIEEHVLDALLQLWLDVLVDRELPGVDDSHVETGTNRVVEEGRMHRLAHDVVAAEGEAEVRDSTRGADTGTALLDPGQALEERARIVVVLFDPGRNCEHVRVEHDVLGPEADLADKQVVGAAADRHATLDLGGLALLVERHHDDSRPVVADAARVVQELVFAFLERDRVDDALPLQALEAGLDHGPLRAVDHHRQARDLRLGGDHVEEGPHRLLAFEQIGVHVHVDQVCATANLLERDVDRGVEVVGFDQAAEACGAGHVRALSDQDETGVLPDLERLEAAESRRATWRRDRTRFEAPHGRRDRLRVLGRRPATGSGDVEEAVARELVQQRQT